MQFSPHIPIYLQTHIYSQCKMSIESGRRAELNDTKIFLLFQLWAEIQALEIRKTTGGLSSFLE